ncbi:phosphoribosyltransferase family protein [Patescibacteria group bacterium]
MKSKKKLNQVFKKKGKEYYHVNLCGLRRDLPLFEVAPNIKIAIFNILGDTEIVKKTAAALAKKLPKNAVALVTPEVKSVPLAYELSRIIKIPYVVTRKIKKPYMVNSLASKVVSITTGKPQTIWLDGKDRKILKNKKVILVDDVVSTGSTLKGLRDLMKKAGAKIIAEAAVFTEGDEKKWKQIISLGNLPVFITKK